MSGFLGGILLGLIGGMVVAALILEPIGVLASPPVMSALIALCALLFAVYQAHLARRHTRIMASSKAHFGQNWSQSANNTVVFEVVVTNPGPGIALITKIVATRGTEEVALAESADWRQWLPEFLLAPPLPFEVKIKHVSTTAPLYLTAGSREHLFVLTLPYAQRNVFDGRVLRASGKTIYDEPIEFSVTLTCRLPTLGQASAAA